MSVIGHNILAGAAGNQGYTVNRSLRLRSSASAYLNRTPASAGNRQKWTISFWLKRGLITNGNMLPIYGAGLAANNHDRISFEASADAFQIFYDYGGANYAGVATNAVLRDPSAWYHCMIAMDTTQSTQSNRAIIYINGVQQSTSNINGGISLNFSWNINNNIAQNISRWSDGSAIRYFDGYLAEFYFIDGQQLTPSSFGAYDGNGVWQPKKYGGTYGTNGYYLPFSNTTSTTTLVADSSGNGNNWTPNNISLTSGYTYDSMLDSPSNIAGTSTGVGNYCIVMPNAGAGGSITNGNLTISGLAGQADQRRASLAVSSGKWYYEVNLPTLGSAGIMWGIIETSAPYSAALYGSVFAYQAFTYSGITYIQKHNNSTANTNLTSATAGDVLQLALDLDNNKIWFGKNNTWADSGNPSTGANTAFTVTAGNYVPAFRPSDGSTSYSMEINFGQRPYTYTPPTGFKAFNTFNLPVPTITNGAQYMAATTYTGNGSTQTITNGGNNTLGITFQPDLVWMKKRSAVGNNYVQDSVRGSSLVFYTDLNNAENSIANGLASFNSNGFSLGNNVDINGNGASEVAWQWKAGAGTTSTNTSGSITSTVSTSAQSGCSIVSYTGTGSAATVGHSLGVAPSMIIVKCRTLAIDWIVYHISNGNNAFITLNNASTLTTGASYMWNSTSPTSSVFSINTDAGANSARPYVAYCFAPIRGYSAFGNYTGNGGGTNGVFVYTGFRPRYILIKGTQIATEWLIIDSSRNTYNSANYRLDAQSSAAEQTIVYLDIFSNGFKMVNPSSYMNDNGSNFIWAAFAENPFNYSRAR